MRLRGETTWAHGDAFYVVSGGGREAEPQSSSSIVEGAFTKSRRPATKMRVLGKATTDALRDMPDGELRRISTMDIVSIVRRGLCRDNSGGLATSLAIDSTVSKLSPHPQSLAALAENLGGDLVGAVASGETHQGLVVAVAEVADCAE